MAARRGRLFAFRPSQFRMAGGAYGDETMSETRTLQASPRDRVGKGAARAARREGLIPAVIYGDKKDPRPILIPFKEMYLAMQRGGLLTTMFDITVDGATERALPRDVQVDVIKGTPTHVDFLRVNARSVVAVEVPVHFVNEDAAPGLTEGGVLNVVRHAVELNAPAGNIPDSVEVDLTGITLDDAIRMSNVKLPEGVEPVETERDFMIATITPPSIAPAEEGEEEAPDADEVPAIEQDAGAPDAEASEASED